MIVVRYRRPAELLADWFNHGRLGGFFVPTRENLAVGTEVPVELRFGDGKAFRTRCRVAWRRVAGASDLPPGLGLELLSTERHVRGLLLAHASGRPIEWIERHAGRVPAELRVRLRAGDLVWEEVTEDISEHGLFLRTPAQLDPGEPVVVTLRPPGRVLGIRIPGEVARREPGSPGGLAIRFLPGTDRLARRLATLVDGLRRHQGPKVTLVTPLRR